MYKIANLYYIGSNPILALKNDWTINNIVINNFKNY